MKSSWPVKLFFSLAVLVLPALCARGGTIDVSNPENVLPGDGRTVTASSVLAGFGPASAVIDNLAADNAGDAPFLFGAGDTDQRIAITGFDAVNGFETLRFFSVNADTTRQIGTVEAFSSTSVISTANALTSSNYETDLGTFPNVGRIYQPYIVGVDPNGRGYFDITVAAPAGTQSLLVDLGTVIGAGSGDRVYEIQALAAPVPVPEPASLTLALVGLAGVMGLVWKKRNRS